MGRAQPAFNTFNHELGLSSLLPEGWMEVWQELDRSTRRNLGALFGVGLLFWASLTMMLSTLALYIESVGGSPQSVGVVIGGFTVGLVLFRPRLAKLADQHSRKLVLLIGMAATAIAPLGYAWVSDLRLLFAIRVFHGLSVAAFTIASSTLVVDLAPPSVRTEVISYMSLTTPVGMSLGPALGSFTLDRWGYGPMFWISAGLGGLGWGLALAVREGHRDLDRLPLPPASTNSPQLPFWSLLKSPAVHIPALMLLLVGLAFGTLMTFLPLYLKQERVPLVPGLFYSAAAMTSFCSRLAAGQVVRRWGRGLLLSLGMGGYSLALIWLFLARTPVEFLIGAVIEGACFGVLIPMVSAMMAERALPQERARMFGVCLLGLDLGGAIAAPLFGTLAEQWGYRPLFALASSCTALALLLFLTRSSKGPGHSLRFALGRGHDGYAIHH